MVQPNSSPISRDLMWNYFEALAPEITWSCGIPSQTSVFPSFVRFVMFLTGIEENVNAAANCNRILKRLSVWECGEEQSSYLLFSSRIFTTPALLRPAAARQIRCLKNVNYGETSRIYSVAKMCSPSLSVSGSGSALVKRLACILFVMANLWKCPPWRR